MKTKIPELKFSNDPPEDFIAENPDGSKYIPIQFVEFLLDEYIWSERNFHFQVFKNGYADICIAASIELEITYSSESGALISRTFVGASSFSLKSIEPNTHFLATAKSECIKNAASDIGSYFGRGLNKDIVPVSTSQEKKVVKSKPDAKILKRFEEAIASGDEAAITMLTNIYDIKTN